jgi:hypothetical protein
MQRAGYSVTMTIRMALPGARRVAAIEFPDGNNQRCSVEESRSAAGCLWIGLDGEHRMHLTRANVAALLPYLREFVATGALLTPQEAGDGR